MFKRLIYENWQTWIPIASFIITFSVFILFFIRAIRLEKKEADRMAHLPLNHDDGTTEIHNNSNNKNNKEETPV